MPDIKEFYKKIWSGYDYINIVMTFGLDYFWRKKAASEASHIKGAWLDMCCGTGELLRHIRKNNYLSVHGCDFSTEMLRAAANKYKDINYCTGDAAHLPYCSEAFNGLSVAFATRNLQNASGGLQKIFKEFHRVLKPGGMFINLETSQPSSSIIIWAYHLFTRLWVAPIGSLLSGDRASYRYLASSMREFHTGDELTEILKEAGFQSVKVTKLMFGATAIHIAVK